MDIARWIVYNMYVRAQPQYVIMAVLNIAVE